MNPKAIYTPAVKLSSGEILHGASHFILALEAIDMGMEKNLIAGHLNYKDVFFPMSPSDEELVPKLKSEKDAINFANQCSKGERDACERLIHTNEFFKVVVERWDNLRRLPMVAAAKRLDNGYVYVDGSAHGIIKGRHPDITFNETANRTHQLCIPGFLHDDGRFFDRKQAAVVCLSLTGITLNEEKMISGEEWIPILKDENDAIDFGERMHLKGFYHAKERIDIFTSLRKHESHVRLLTVAVRTCERKRASEIRSRTRRRKR